MTIATELKVAGISTSNIKAEELDIRRVRVWYVGVLGCLAVCAVDRES
jgi:hypothetical protein